MDKKRLRVALKVLEAVKTEYLQTKKFIENVMDEECQKENMSMVEVIFLPVQKQIPQKKIFCFAVSMLRDLVLS